MQRIDLTQLAGDLLVGNHGATPYRQHAHDFLAVARDAHFLALLDQFDQGGKAGFGFVDTFVNFLFRKNLYVNGIAKCLAQLERMGQKIIPCMEQSALTGETAELEQLIVALELQWNHNRRRQE